MQKQEALTLPRQL